MLLPLYKEIDNKHPCLGANDEQNDPHQDANNEASPDDVEVAKYVYIWSGYNHNYLEKGKRKNLKHTLFNRLSTVLLTSESILHLSCF